MVFLSLNLLEIAPLKHNGPAIWGGCVTRRKHRAESWYFSQLVVTVQGGYGTSFCSPGTKLAEHYDCRGTSYLTNGELSRYCYFVNSCGAVRICQALRFCLGGRSKSKNRDKQLTHIVRVRFSCLFSHAVKKLSL
jgi:hypothetical protein